jgi:hypothetical protein
MSLSRHLLAILLIGAPTIGCDVEDDDKTPPAAPAPAEPTRPVPQPQVGYSGRAERLLATGSPPAAGPAFAPLAG